MKPIRIFRHVDCEGPGFLQDFLDVQGVPSELVKIDEGMPVPMTIDDVSGLVFMGGSMSVNDDLPWIVQELDLIRRAANSKLPVLGHCLGGQLIAKALGGQVTANQVKEIGWFEVTRSSTAAAQQWLADMPETMTVYHWHGEMFSLPPGAQLILENLNCPHQAFVVGNMLAMQCHVEMTVDLVREWASRFEDQLRPGSETVQTPEQMLAGLEMKVENLQNYARHIYSHWLSRVAT
ncbi:MAG: type 1 glutamine amidotransferase [Gammaproteobacteria bacterium]|nr:type 1 glutamine amidotransferase [Gammaproteobacteria bacterium]